MASVMKGIGIELALWLAFSIMQCGPVVGSMEYGSGDVPMSFILLMVPFSLLVLVVVFLTTRYAVPSLLMHQRWGKYLLFTFGLSYFTSFIELFLTRYMWVRLHIIPGYIPMDWGGLALNSVSNSLMFGFTLLAVGVWRLVQWEQRDLALERSVTEEIEKYIAAVKGKLNPDKIINRMGEIADEVISDPKKGEEDIADLCSELREELYHLPTPPSSDRITGVVSLHTPFNSWLTSRRYRMMRFIVFQLTLIAICFGAFFSTPDRPEYEARFGGFLILTAMFEIMAAIVVYVFSPRYRKRRNLKGFWISITILAVLILLPILAERVLLFMENPVRAESLFIFTTVLATLASMLMIIFYLGGIGSVLLYSDWVKESHRITLLSASTRRLEYVALKKQINPHFLFNVLNNAMIQTNSEPVESRNMLLELQRLLDYQFHEAEGESVLLTETIRFLKAYLELESTRQESFRYSIRTEGDVDNVELPTLLFIPFVENAVKYGERFNETNDVEVTFAAGAKRLRFECTNPFSDSNCGDGRGNIIGEKGIGVANTLRRLEILYDSDFYYRSELTGGRYVVELDIPLKKR